MVIARSAGWNWETSTNIDNSDIPVSEFRQVAETLVFAEFVFKDELVKQAETLAKPERGGIPPFDLSYNT